MAKRDQYDQDQNSKTHEDKLEPKLSSDREKLEKQASAEAQEKAKAIADKDKEHTKKLFQQQSEAEEKAKSEAPSEEQIKKEKEEAEKDQALKFEQHPLDPTKSVPVSNVSPHLSQQALDIQKLDIRGRAIANAKEKGMSEEEAKSLLEQNPANADMLLSL